jgi:hypothetical protein
MACSKKAPCNHGHWNRDTSNTRSPIILGYLFGGIVNSFKHCLKNARKCSMRFKSGGCACCWRSWNGCDANHSCTILLMCFGSLSYWKTNLPRSKLWFYIVDHKIFFYNIFLQLSSIHPTFNFVSCSGPKNRHASPNHHRSTIMFHGLVDMLRSNAFSISNSTPWPTIWVRPIYLCFVTQSHAFLIIINSQFSYLCANLRRKR